MPPPRSDQGAGAAQAAQSQPGPQAVRLSLQNAIPIPTTAGAPEQRKGIAELEAEIEKFAATWGKKSAPTSPFLTEQRARLAEMQGKLVTNILPEERVAAAKNVSCAG